MSDFVYLIQAPSVGRVKIGVTNDVKKRFSTLKTASPVELVLIGWFMAPRSFEKEIHMWRRGFRRRGEWFEMTERNIDVLKYQMVQEVVILHGGYVANWSEREVWMAFPPHASIEEQEQVVWLRSPMEMSMVDALADAGQDPRDAA